MLLKSFIKISMYSFSRRTRQRECRTATAVWQTTIMPLITQPHNTRQRQRQHFHPLQTHTHIAPSPPRLFCRLSRSAFVFFHSLHTKHSIAFVSHTHTTAIAPKLIPAPVSSVFISRRDSLFLFIFFVNSFLSRASAILSSCENMAGVFRRRICADPMAPPQPHVARLHANMPNARRGVCIVRCCDSR